MPLSEYYLKFGIMLVLDIERNFIKKLSRANYLLLD